MIKVLQMVPSSRGGAASHVRDLALGLPAADYQVNVVMPLDGGNIIPQHFTEANVTLIPAAIDAGLSLNTWQQVRNTLQQGQYDILHLHGARAAFWGRLATFGLRPCPTTIYSIHGFMIPHYAWHRRTLFTLQEKLQARQIDHFIAVSQAEKENIRRIRLGNDNNTSVIWYGIDVDNFRHPQTLPDTLRAQLHIPAEDVLFTMICRFFWPRDFPTLLRAFHQALTQVPNIHLLLVGDGPWKPQIETLLDELNLRSHVTLPGLRRDVPDLLHAADVFVLTSGGGDGLPISILEAMAAARPVIATASDGIPEEIIHNETGLLVPLRDVSALAQAIVQLAQDQTARQQMGAANLQRVQQHFTRQQMVDNIADLYRRLMRHD